MRSEFKWFPAQVNPRFTAAEFCNGRLRQPTERSDVVRKNLKGYFAVVQCHQGVQVNGQSQNMLFRVAEYNGFPPEDKRPSTPAGSGSVMMNRHSALPMHTSPVIQAVRQEAATGSFNSMVILVHTPNVIFSAISIKL